MIDESAKSVVDYTMGGVTVATVVGLLPHIATVLTVLWFAIRIWESATARRLLRAVCAKCAEWWDK